MDTCRGVRLHIKPYAAHSLHRLVHERPPAPGTVLRSRRGPRSGTTATGAWRVWGISKLSAMRRAYKNKSMMGLKTHIGGDKRTSVSGSSSNPVAEVSRAETSGT